jgi:hypothetical protein
MTKNPTKPATMWPSSSIPELQEPMEELIERRVDSTTSVANRNTGVMALTTFSQTVPQKWEIDVEIDAEMDVMKAMKYGRTNVISSEPR